MQYLLAGKINVYLATTKKVPICTSINIKCIVYIMHKKSSGIFVVVVVVVASTNIFII